jgi:aspartate aminotransferase-like enzyme
MEDEFYDTYRKVGEKLSSSYGTANEVIIQSGEAMSILWGALKSCILPGEESYVSVPVFFGSGFADMAKSLKADVNLLEFGFDETLHDFDRIESVVKNFFSEGDHSGSL